MKKISAVKRRFIGHHSTKQKPIARYLEAIQIRFRLDSRSYPYSRLLFEVRDASRRKVLANAAGTNLNCSLPKRGLLVINFYAQRAMTLFRLISSQRFPLFFLHIHQYPAATATSKRRRRRVRFFIFFLLRLFFIDSASRYISKLFTYAKTGYSPLAFAN